MSTKKVMSVLCFFIFFSVLAQDGWAPPASDPGFGESNNDAATNAPSVLPIDGLTLPLIFTGVLVGLYIIKKRKGKSIKS